MPGQRMHACGFGWKATEPQEASFHRARWEFGSSWIPSSEWLQKPENIVDFLKINAGGCPQLQSERKPMVLPVRRHLKQGLTQKVCGMAIDTHSMV